MAVPRKKKRPVKSKKMKQQSKEDDLKDAMDCSICSDDLVYIRVGAGGVGALQYQGVYTK